MKRHFILQFVFTLLLASAVGCGGASEREPATDHYSEGADNTEQRENESASSPEQGFAEAMNALGSAARNAGGVDPVDFRELKALLPEKAAGLARTNATGERGGVFGIKVSNAEGTYGDGGERSISLTITDMGSIKGAAMLGYAWLMAEIDREDDNGYERTTKFEGHPAYEKFSRGDSFMNAEMQVVIADRFIVQAESRNVRMEGLKDAVNEIDLEKLDRMKNEGVEAQ